MTTGGILKMKTLESKNMTVGEAKVKVYQAIESLGYELDLEELNELKEFILDYAEKNGGSERVKNIFTFVFDNYNELKGLIN